ncbi:MAG: ANTAR domain-containing protein [Methylophilales bacterium]|nr:ANTAR domain-containing protein [Methylophilales bacterium]
MLKVLLVDQSMKRSMPLKQALTEVGYEVVGRISDCADLNQVVAKLQPDVIVIDVDSPSRDTLEHIVVSGQDTPRPIVMFTHDGDVDKIRSATKVGVSAYVVGGLESARIRPIIDAAMARFEEFSVMKQELQSVTLKLSERKNVERAKGVLMKQKGLSESEAYNLMRKMAMDRNIKLADLAQQLVEAASLLL